MNLVDVFKEKKEKYGNEELSIAYYKPNNSIQIYVKEQKEALVLFFDSEGVVNTIFYKPYLYERGLGEKVFDTKTEPEFSILNTIRNLKLKSVLECEFDFIMKAKENKSIFTDDMLDKAVDVKKSEVFAEAIVEAVRKDDKLYLIKEEKEIPIEETPYKDWHLYNSEREDVSFLVKDEQLFLEITRSYEISEIAEFLQSSENEILHLIEKVQDTLIDKEFNKDKDAELEQEVEM